MNRRLRILPGIREELLTTKVCCGGQTKKGTTEPPKHKRQKQMKSSDDKDDSLDVDSVEHSLERDDAKDETVKEPELLHPESKVDPKNTPDVLEVIHTLERSFFPDEETVKSFKPEELLSVFEEVWWYYGDVYRMKYPSLPSFSFKQFVKKFVKHSPWLRSLEGFGDNESLKALLSQFSEYKETMPCAGVAILSKDLKQVVLVQGVWKNAHWGFPKGKLKPGEDPKEGALREVAEETGVDVSSFLVPEVKIERKVGLHNITLFIAAGFPKIKLRPQTKNEIYVCSLQSIFDYFIILFL